MFPLTRSFRQVTATVALLALTIVPTCFVAVWAWRINRPGHVRDVEIELRRRLGLQVSLQSVRYPRPAEVTYGGVVLRQEEPAARSFSEIARADLVNALRDDRELTLHVESPRIHSESPAAALAQLGTLLQQSGQLGVERINLAAPTGELELGGDELRFQVADVAGELALDADAPVIRLAYRLPSQAGPTRCELTLTRDRRAEPVSTSLVMKTVEGIPLPARALNVFFEADEWLGSDASFEGSVTLHRAGTQEWEAEFQGELHDVDLSRLIGKRFPRHRLSGRARVTIEYARWGPRPGQGSGWVEAKGALLTGQGAIGLELVDALAREMKFRPGPRLARVNPSRTEIEFRALGLSFELRSNGEIQLAGALGAEFPPDAVLAGATSSLLSAPQGTASVHSLIKTLFPVAQSDQRVLIPLTAESRVLMSLPLPPQAGAGGRKALDGN
jgi:hypothetical protein